MKISAPAGGEVKSFRLTVQLPPPWHCAQPACKNRLRPAIRSPAAAPPGKPATGPLGVRTALRTHSRNAVNAGTLFALPGRVTVTCARSALARAKALSTLGATFRSPLSPINKP